MGERGFRSPRERAIESDHYGRKKGESEAMVMKRLLLTGFVLLFAGSLALAQDPPSGRFQGTVSDDVGNPLPGVTVEAPTVFSASWRSRQACTS
jgi:hypothetical protein